jgi:guanylate kinase
MKQGLKQECMIICGQSGSGKDFLLRGLKKMDLKYDPKITTRPKRSLERDGIEYNFITNDEFKILLSGDKIKTYQHFVIEGEDWYYAITKENFDNNHLFIMTPHELSQIPPEDRKNCFVVYLDIDEDVRRSRITRRNDNNDSVERRIQSDKLDFKDFTDYDLRLNDSDFEVDMVYSLMS